MMRRRITTSTRHRRHSTFGSLFLLLFLSWNKTTTPRPSSSSTSSNRSNRSNGSNILRRFCLHRHRHLYHLFIILLRSNAVKIYAEKTSHTIEFWIKKNVTSHLKKHIRYYTNNIIISMFAISSSSTIQCQIQANQHACSSRCACAGRRRG